MENFYGKKSLKKTTISYNFEHICKEKNDIVDFFPNNKLCVYELLLISPPGNTLIEFRDLYLSTILNIAKTLFWCCSKELYYLLRVICLQFASRDYHRCDYHGSSMITGHRKTTK